MEELAATTIIPISVYCFILAAYFFYLAVNAILGDLTNLSEAGFGLWFPVVIGLMLAGGLVNVGLGFLKVKKVYWRILFFGLAICVSCATSFIFAYFILLWIGLNLLTILYLDQISPVTWYSFLGIFLSSIIILYYLSHEEVLKYFGDPGPLLTPF